MHYHPDSKYYLLKDLVRCAGFLSGFQRYSRWQRTIDRRFHLTTRCFILFIFCSGRVYILRRKEREYSKEIFGCVTSQLYQSSIPQQKYSYNIIEYFVDKNKYISGGGCYVLPLFLIYNEHSKNNKI